MSEQIKFTEEKRGYSKEEVDTYVKMLQNAIIQSENKFKNHQKLQISQQKENEAEKKNLADLRQKTEEQSQKIAVLQKENERMRQEALDKSRQVELLEKEQKEKDALIREAQKTQKTQKAQENASSMGIEELFKKAQKSADEYVRNVKNEVERERNLILKENQKMIEEAKEQAARIVEEAQNVKQTELDDKLSQIAVMEKEKKEELAELLLSARDELESAKAEAEGIRAQSQLVLEQAEKRKDKILARARDKASRLSGPLEEECNQMTAELTAAGEKFVKLFREVQGYENGKKE